MHLHPRRRLPLHLLATRLLAMPLLPMLCRQTVMHLLRSMPLPPKQHTTRSLSTRGWAWVALSSLAQLLLALVALATTMASCAAGDRVTCKLLVLPAA